MARLVEAVDAVARGLQGRCVMAGSSGRVPHGRVPLVHIDAWGWGRAGTGQPHTQAAKLYAE